MLKRKAQDYLREYFERNPDKIMIVEGARQVGKSYIIRETAKEYFTNYIELNFAEDALGSRLFANVRTTSDFYLRVSMVAGERMGNKEDTLVFLDEIQEYPEFLTLLKFLRQDARYTYIASGSLLGITLKKTASIPVGSVEFLRMYPLDFEEFLYANGFGEVAVSALRQKFEAREYLDEEMHRRMMELFRMYLLVGGMPDAVNEYISTGNVVNFRRVQNDIRRLYEDDASKYEKEASRKLKIRRIYSMIPSNMENKKKRMVVKDIEGKKGKRYSDYEEEFEYLITAGIALDVKAVPTPVFPLAETATKNLLKLYLNDVGLLTGVLYQNNIRAVLDEETGVNLGAVYESVVAQELKAHGHELYYYDNRTKGEVDYLINDYENLASLPVEVKSGKDYTVHSALSAFVGNKDYGVKNGIVFSNAREIRTDEKVTYYPVYDVMFL